MNIGATEIRRLRAELVSQEKEWRTRLDLKTIAAEEANERCDEMEQMCQRLLAVEADLRSLVSQHEATIALQKRLLDLEGETKKGMRDLLKGIMNVQDLQDRCWCSEDETQGICEACRARSVVNGSQEAIR